MGHKNADTVVVLDLETTGFSPRKGDRTIEVGAVLIEHGTITDHFQGVNESWLSGQRVYFRLHWHYQRHAGKCTTVQ